MTLSQFKKFLKRCVASEFITQSEATQLERDFEDGKISEDDLPIDAAAYVALNSNDVDNAAKVLAGMGYKLK